MEYGLIGKTLGHSFSKPIHEALAGQLAVRRPLYEAACHARVENAGSFEAAVAAAKEAFYEVLDREWA